VSLIEIYRSTALPPCEQRALVLRAMGIASQIVPDTFGFAVYVEEISADVARDQLERYESENSAPTSAAQPTPTPHAFAWLAPLLYAVTLVSAGFFAGRAAFGFDWYAAGALSAATSENHEWWRAITALMLHIDHAHLLSNIGFGVLFCFTAARLVGSGVAFASVIICAAMANVLDALLMPRAHVSIGASTIVFAALGLISAYSWRLQFSKRMRWAHRWAPLVIGIAMLGLIGSGGENTDVLAHLAGFFCGALFGVLLARMPARVLESRVLQIATGAGAISLLVGAWIRAGLSQ
jgi:rhomboid protease GluP